MISVEAQVRAALIADTVLSGLVGARVYLLTPPENPTYPNIVYQRISTNDMNTQDRGAGASVGRTRFQFTVWCQGPSSGTQSDTIARALRDVMYSRLNAHTPANGNQSPNFLVSRRMGTEPNTQPPLFKQSLDFMIWYQDQ